MHSTVRRHSDPRKHSTLRGHSTTLRRHIALRRRSTLRRHWILARRRLGKDHTLGMRHTMKVRNHSIAPRSHSVMLRGHYIMPRTHVVLLEDHVVLLRGHAILMREYTMLLRKHSGLLRKKAILTRNHARLLDKHVILLRKQGALTLNLQESHILLWSETGGSGASCHSMPLINPIKTPILCCLDIRMKEIMSCLERWIAALRKRRHLWDGNRCSRDTSRLLSSNSMGSLTKAAIVIVLQRRISYVGIYKTGIIQRTSNAFDNCAITHTVDHAMLSRIVRSRTCTADNSLLDSRLLLSVAIFDLRSRGLLRLCFASRSRRARCRSRPNRAQFARASGERGAARTLEGCLHLDRSDIRNNLDCLFCGSNRFILCFAIT
ncbi:hypothetical protein QBC38DRAFT_218552 [Podospora fimiseda]|uniref:Uncharacterized protein n=1 Tax=Podospora fimiseda TaxID=252190 RepID=A0AAN7BNR6_9PEZI|nr:hypothetical protein QBC38DRAFT_218552 [Podospora fimiseda]